eukprot:807266_1
MMSKIIALFSWLIIGGLCSAGISLELTTIAEIFDYYAAWPYNNMTYSQFSYFIYDYSGAVTIFDIIDINHNDKLEYFEFMYYLDNLHASKNLTSIWFIEDTIHNDTILSVADTIIKDLNLAKSTWDQLYHEIIVHQIFLLFHFQDEYLLGSLTTDDIFALEKDYISYEEWFKYYHNIHIPNEWKKVNSSVLSVERFKEIIHEFDAIAIFARSAYIILHFMSDYYFVDYFTLEDHNISESDIMTDIFSYGFIKDSTTNIYDHIATTINGQANRRRLLNWFDDMCQDIGMGLAGAVGSGVAAVAGRDYAEQIFDVNPLQEGNANIPKNAPELDWAALENPDWLFPLIGEDGGDVDLPIMEPIFP